MKNKSNKLKIFVLMFFALLIGFSGTNLFFSRIEIVSVSAIDDLPEEYCLRDYYLIATENQNPYGLCWDFASSMAFSTAVVKHTNQYLDFSNSWISVSASVSWPDFDEPLYNPGDGGGFGVFDRSARNCGIVLEQDLNYESNFWLVNENKYDYYNFFKQYADMEIMKNYQKVEYRIQDMSDAVEKESVFNQVKKHIIENSAVYVDCVWITSNVTYNSKQIQYKTFATSTSYHALPIIGWDDNIQINIDNDVHVGAWIVLNDYGNISGNSQGVAYILYDDDSIDDFDGYKYSHSNDSNFEITSVSSNADAKTKYRGSYYGNFVANESASTLHKNIFYGTNDVQLNFSYAKYNGYSIKAIDIYNYGDCVTNNFNVSYNNNNISISSNNCEVGAYKVKITLFNGNDEIFSNTSFYVCDGNEIEDFRYFNFDSNSRGYITGDGFYQYYGNLNTNLKETVFHSTSKTGSIELYFVVETNCCIHQGIFNGQATNVGSAYYVVIPYNLDESDVYTITFVSDYGERDFNIHILYGSAEDELVLINYALNDGINSENNLKRGLISEDNDIVLYAPTRDGYNFAGWYTSSTFDEDSALEKVRDEYLLKNNQIVCYDTNTVTYPTALTHFNKYIKKSNTAFVYAKWEAEGNNDGNENNEANNEGKIALIIIAGVGVTILTLGTISFVYIRKNNRRYNLGE